MGALLALKPDIDIESWGLKTEPARMLARAFQDYGAYIVDDPAWDVYAIMTEQSPEGRFVEEFKRAWGFDFVDKSTTSPWALDIARIFSNLHVVANNGPNSIGGGGTPRQPLAPPFESEVTGTVPAMHTPEYELFGNRRPARYEDGVLYDVAGRRVEGECGMQGAPRGVYLHGSARPLSGK